MIKHEETWESCCPCSLCLNDNGSSPVCIIGQSGPNEHCESFVPLPKEELLVALLYQKLSIYTKKALQKWLK
jgi:hypothetical protein